MEPRSISVTTANLWRENPQIERDLRTLTGTGAEIIGLNEAAPFVDELHAAAKNGGYKVVGDRKGRSAHVPILLRDDHRASWQHRTLSRAVGSSPERVGTAVRTEVDGVKVAAINFHANSHVQAGPEKPHDLPRTREFVDSMKGLTAWVRELEADGYRVIVLGDLNWAWTSRVAQWLWSPRKVFDRLGMVTQYDLDNPPRPKGDARRIEYVAWNPRHFAYRGQQYVTPEKSDHPWIEVTLTLKPPV